MTEQRNNVSLANTAEIEYLRQQRLYQTLARSSACPSLLRISFRDKALRKRECAVVHFAASILCGVRSIRSRFSIYARIQNSAVPLVGKHAGLDFSAADRQRSGVSHARAASARAGAARGKSKCLQLDSIQGF